MRVAIDIGHPKQRVAEGGAEWPFCLAIFARLPYALGPEHQAFAIAPHLSQSERLFHANKHNADIYIALRMERDSRPGWTPLNGATITSNSAGYKIGTAIASAFRDLVPVSMRNGGAVRVREDLFVTKKQGRPTVIVSCGYLSNTLDSMFLASQDGARLIAAAIAAGVTNGAA